MLLPRGPGCADKRQEPGRSWVCDHAIIFFPQQLPFPCFLCYPSHNWGCPPLHTSPAAPQESRASQGPPAGSQLLTQPPTPSPPRPHPAPIPPAGSAGPQDWPGAAGEGVASPCCPQLQLGRASRKKRPRTAFSAAAAAGPGAARALLWLQLASASATCRDMLGTNQKVSCCLTFLCVTERWQ